MLFLRNKRPSGTSICYAYVINATTSPTQTSLWKTCMCYSYATTASTERWHVTTRQQTRKKMSLLYMTPRPAQTSCTVAPSGDDLWTFIYKIIGLSSREKYLDTVSWLPLPMRGISSYSILATTAQEKHAIRRGVSDGGAALQGNNIPANRNREMAEYKLSYMKVLTCNFVMMTLN